MNSLRIVKYRQRSIDKPGKYVIYWMHQSQRVQYNHALEHAINVANANNLPLLVFFGLTSDYHEANQRHYRFLLEGLKEVKENLEKLNISFVIKYGIPSKTIIPLLKDANSLIMDKGYLRLQRKWREDVLDEMENNDFNIDIYIVDTDLIVPVEVASNKTEYGAYTLRPKIKKKLEQFLDFDGLSKIKNTSRINIPSDDKLEDIDKTIKRLGLSNTLKPSDYYRGGYSKASKLLNEFISIKINHYLESNDPSLDYTSTLSPYLHFGQISSLEIYDRLSKYLKEGKIEKECFDAFTEQLIVRRELAFNYVYYRKGYDEFENMSEPWAYRTMRDHKNDKRHYTYSLKDIESYKTHDPYFNAAMKEMVVTGYMHNYMRMYWAKKIIEWTPSFKEAYERILYLNNKYLIDGRDPNSYAGVAWCFGKHDRAWTEREIFGKLRYMNSKGLERKFDIDKYIKSIKLGKYK